jgi:hypothetical protein
MDENDKQYLTLLSEIIAKMVIIFGSDVAISKARSVEGLILDDNGKVTDIKGYTIDKVEELVNSYIKMSDVATKNIIDSIFIKYPQIKRIS